MNALVADHIESLNPKLWKGFRLIAGDGTTVNLPVSLSIKKHFKIFASTAKGTKTCMANACMLYDVLTHLVIDANIQPTTTGELTMLNEMIDKHIFGNAIILLDRGFGRISMCKRLMIQKLDFCIRMKISQSNFAKQVFENPLTDFIVDWYPSDGEKETCRGYNLDTEPIKVRVTKVTLNTGEIELLVSSLLDRKTVCESDMQQLYNLRWGIEEGYKVLKPKMKLEQFGCKKPEGVYQEFYAHIFMMNLVTLIGNQTDDKIEASTKKRKYKYKYNWQTAFRSVRSQFVEIFHRAKFESSLDWLIENISKSLVAIIPNRSFERNMTGSKKRRYYQCYK